MPYWGKIIGVMAGLATGRPWLALLGLILGHQFDRGLAKRFSYFERNSFDTRFNRLPDDFIKALFQTMGYLAKADGRVTEDEIRAARALMHRLGLGPSGIRQAIEWFESGKKQSFPLGATMRQLRRESARRGELRGLFVRLLMEVSLSKNLFDQNITEIRTLQNEVIGTINTLGCRKFQVSNYKNERVLLPSFDDSRTFILSCYYFAGRHEDPMAGLQLHMF